MIYEHLDPSETIRHMVKCFWIVDSEGARSVVRQRIIPDGYPELIVHYGDPYEINLSGVWECQEKLLLAGQIRNHFFLRNTGSSGMLGIKLQPTALYEMFGMAMSEVTDRVVPLYPEVQHALGITAPRGRGDCQEIIHVIEENLKAHAVMVKGSAVRKAVDFLREQHGMVGIRQLCDVAGVGERHLERMFKQQVGLSPKRYSRILRIGHIFELVQKKDFSWAQVAAKAGFTDQSHFIKNFQEFTGEDPAKYLFNQQDMANFFLT